LLRMHGQQNIKVVRMSYAVSSVLYFVTEFRLSAEPLEYVAVAKSRANPESTQQSGVGGSFFVLIDSGNRLMAPLLFRSKSEVVQRLAVSRSLMFHSYFLS
jgi:hypothetical protein